MKLLFLVHNPVFGGGQGQIVTLREPLAARGWDVVAAVPDEGDAAERLRAGGLEVETLPLHRLRATPDPRVQLPFLASFAPEVRALRALVRRRGIDVVQPHGPTNPHGAIAAHLEGRAVAWQIYDTVAPMALRRVSMPLVTRLADVITTWGEELGRVHPGASSLGDRWIPVFPPVDGARFAPDPARRSAARAELGLATTDLAVGMVAMRNPTKGHQHFVRALGRARQDAPSLVGRLLGPPSPAHAAYEAEFRAEAAALGLQDALDIRDAGRRVPDLMPGLDVVTLASVPRSEGMPTVLLEAMACGLPTVATDVGAVRELVADGETGFVVAPEDPDALAAAWLRLARDPELRARMGDAGRRRFLERFSLDVLADRYAGAYSRAIDHRRARRPR